MIKRNEFGIVEKMEYERIERKLTFNHLWNGAGDPSLGFSKLLELSRSQCGNNIASKSMRKREKSQRLPFNYRVTTLISNEESELMKREVIF